MLIRDSLRLTTALIAVFPVQGPGQPRVAPGPNEPDWSVVLDGQFRLRMFADLANPVTTTPEATPGLFRKAGPGPVRFRPLIALGLETVNRGGWYRPGDDPARPDRTPLWSYRFKHTSKDFEASRVGPPPLADGSVTEFDPGDRPFGLWVSNDGLDDGGVFSQPSTVKAVNARLRKQPYKLMIYPYRDRATGEDVAGSYVLGWEYSTNDDFQDVVCRVDNVRLVGP